MNNWMTRLPVGIAIALFARTIWANVNVPITSATMQPGTILIGSLANLGANDGSRMVLSSGPSGGGQAIRWTASATVPIHVASLQHIRITAVIQQSSPSTVHLQIWNNVSQSWQTLTSTTVGQANTTMTKTVLALKRNGTGGIHPIHQVTPRYWDVHGVLKVRLKSSGSTSYTMGLDMVKITLTQ